MAVDGQKRRARAIKVNKSNETEEISAIQTIMRPIKSDEEKNNKQEDNEGEWKEQEN